MSTLRKVTARLLLLCAVICFFAALIMVSGAENAEADAVAWDYCRKAVRCVVGMVVTAGAAVIIEEGDT